MHEIIFFFGRNSVIFFDLKNMILIQTKDFPWKIMAQIHQIFEKQVSKSPIFYDKVPVGSQ